MSRRWVLARREVQAVVKERTILLAVVIQVFVAGFSSFLVVGLSALVDPESIANDAVRPTVAVSQNETELIALLRAEGIDVLALPDNAEVTTAFLTGYADGGLLVAFSNETGGPERVTLLLPDGDLRATFTLVQVKDVLQEYERALREERDARVQFDPVHVNVREKGGHYAFVYSLLVPLLVLLPVVLAGALAADSVTEEMQRGTLPLLLVSPATPAEIVEGKILANTAIAPVLSLAWFGLLALNGLPVPVVGGALILLLATALAFLMGVLACLVAFLTRDRNKAHVLYATLLFFLLGASLLLPVSPVNAVAMLAAGSASAAAYAVVAGAVAVAGLAWLALRIVLPRAASAAVAA